MSVDIDFKGILYAVINDCKVYLDNYYSAGIMVGILFIFIYCLIALFFYAGKQQTSRRDIFYVFLKCPFAFLLGFYCYLVWGITILSREKSNIYIIRTIPFTTWGKDLWHLTLWAENILLMIPLGILLYILWIPFRKISRMLIVGVIVMVSLLIECMQYFTRLGKFETDDIINNVLGTWIGFGICKVFDKVRIALISRIPMKL